MVGSSLTKSGAEDVTSDFAEDRSGSAKSRQAAWMTGRKKTGPVRFRPEAGNVSSRQQWLLKDKGDSKVSRSVTESKKSSCKELRKGGAEPSVT